MRPIGTIWFFLDSPRKGGVAFFPSFRFRFDCGQRREDVNDSFSTIDMRMWIEYPSLEAYFCHLSLALLLTVIISCNVTVIRYRSVIKVCLFRENTRLTGRPATIFLERMLLPPRRKIAKIVAISWHRIVPRGFLPRISRIAKRLRDSWSARVVNLFGIGLFIREWHPSTR